MAKMSDKTKQDDAEMRNMSSEAPRGPKMAPRRPKRAPRWPQESPRGPQDSPRRAQDEAKMAQHGASASKWKPKGRNIKNLKKPKENQCFLKVQGPWRSSQLGPYCLKLGLSWAKMS